jgi:hypothetical protein
VALGRKMWTDVRMIINSVMRAENAKYFMHLFPYGLCINCLIKIRQLTEVTPVE